MIPYGSLFDVQLKVSDLISTSLTQTTYNSYC